MSTTAQSPKLSDESSTKKQVPRRSIEELQQFILDYCNGSIFTDRHIHPHDQHFLGMIFMPITFWNPVDIDISSIGLLYEYLHQAGPRSVNGYPIFMSVQMLHKDDTAIVDRLIKIELQNRCLRQNLLAEELKKQMDGQLSLPTNKKEESK